MNYSGPQPYRPPYPYMTPYAQMLPHKRPLRRSANIIGGALLIMEAVMIISYLLLTLGFSQIGLENLSTDTQSLIDTSVSLVSYILAFWIPTAFMVSMIRIPPSVAFPMRKPRLPMVIAAIFLCLGVSIIGSLLTTLISSLTEAVFDVAPVAPDFSLPTGVGALVVHVVSMTFAPAIFEELMFRGVIMQSLRRFGDGFALVVSSILFGLCHGNLVQGPNAMLLGLVIGYFTLRSASLIPGMIIHFVFNGLSVLMQVIFNDLDPAKTEMLNIYVFGGYLLSGAIALLFLVKKYKGLFRIAPSAYPLPTGVKARTFFFSVTVILFILFIALMTLTFFEKTW